tara:strand:- start:730 stop:1017 length:288 start_codon:yes stop_codon:yes gene_type:complete
MKSKIHEYQKKSLTMSKISKVIFAITIVSIFTIMSCRDTKSKTETTEEHGHEHDADGNHIHEETLEQEEFLVTKDSLQAKEEIHTHTNNEEQHNH